VARLGEGSIKNAAASQRVMRVRAHLSMNVRCTPEDCRIRAHRLPRQQCANFGLVRRSKLRPASPHSPDKSMGEARSILLVVRKVLLQESSSITVHQRSSGIPCPRSDARLYVQQSSGIGSEDPLGVSHRMGELPHHSNGAYWTERCFGGENEWAQRGSSGSRA
jgi:hypothetical protein